MNLNFCEGVMMVVYGPNDLNACSLIFISSNACAGILCLKLLGQVVGMTKIVLDNLLKLYGDDVY